MLGRFQLPTVPYLPANRRENQLFVSLHSYHPPLREALQSHGKTINFGSDTSLVPSLAPYILSLNTFLVTLSLEGFLTSLALALALSSKSVRCRELNV